MPPELRNAFIIFSVGLVVTFIAVIIIQVKAYIFTKKKRVEYEKMLEQLKNDGKFADWENDNRLLIILEKSSLWLWFSGIISMAFVPSFAPSFSQQLTSIDKFIFGFGLVILMLLNIISKRMLRKKLLDATSYTNQIAKKK